MSSRTDPFVEHILAEGEAAWPTVRLERDALTAQLARVAAGPDAGSEALHAADLYLVCACLLGDRAALAAFDEHFLRPVDRYVSNVDGSAAFADEVRQKMREELLVAPPGAIPKLAAYSGRGPLGGWLRVVAVRRALNLRRARGPEGTLDASLAAGVPSAEPDPELDYLKALYKNEFRDAFRAALARLDAEQRNAVRVHHLDGLSLDETAVVCRVSRATVARWLAQARAQILTDTQRQLRERLRVDASTMQSILRLVQSQLDLSLHAYLE
jgi:RNA polymerase sigma-70 factor (ECF subfamily)